MDLSVSPDLATYYCYGLVVALGAITAAMQISRRLGDIDGIWFIGRTWFLFFLYLIVPVALFWFLDRTGAISDTSFFAAVLIGVGYERIINGSNQTIRAPGDISQFWTPFIAYADKLSERALKESAGRRARLAEKIITSIVEEHQRYPLWKRWPSVSARISRHSVNNFKRSTRPRRPVALPTSWKRRPATCTGCWLRFPTFIS